MSGIWGSRAPSRADAGALADMNLSVRVHGKGRFGEGAKTHTRGACAPRNAGEVRRPSIVDLFVARIRNPHSAIRNRQSEVEETK